MTSPSANPLATLKKFAVKAPALERCELCGKPIAETHQHLLEPATRRLACACDACTILFDGNPAGRFRRVPRRVDMLPDFCITDPQWEDLHLPISLAFFYQSTPAKRVIAMFPSPAGATESLLTLDAWQNLVYDNPVLLELEPDVEALLVNRVGDLRDYARVPIDECFKLVGIIRTHWRGLSGGTDVWKHIADFYEALKSAPPEALMPDLHFHVDKASAVPYAAAPLLHFSLRITDQSPIPEGASPGLIHTVALRCQIRIEPAQRPYKPAEKERLGDLFGEPARWGQTLRPLLWTHTSLIVPAFTGSTTVELAVPCSYDFNVAAVKYFHALYDGEIPLRLFFSGTIFHAAADHSLQVAQISWEKESPFRLPVQVWKDMMELYYPNSAWLCLRRDAFDELEKYKRDNGIATWEAALETLLADNAARASKEPA